MDTTPMEALILKPDEVLILRVPDMGPDEAQDLAKEVMRTADGMGIRGRVALFIGEFEFAVLEGAR